MYEDKSFLMDVTGERCGQINGLAIYSADFYSFGRPTRITATVSLGSGNIINVEREAGMSGRHYNKGVLIICSISDINFSFSVIIFIILIVLLNHLHIQVLFLLIIEYQT